MTEAVTRMRGADQRAAGHRSRPNTRCSKRRLKLYGGKPIINSINFEDGEEAADKRLRLARRFGTAVIALTIDETGMAKEVEHKLAVARAALRLRLRQARPAADRTLLFDPLTFTICTGNADDRKLGLNTLEAIERIAAGNAGVPDHPRPVEHLLRPQPAGAPCAELGLSRPRAAPRADRRDRAFLADHAVAQDRRRRRCGSPRI